MLKKLCLFFAFCTNYQGINNEGPSNDIEQFKYCTSISTEIGYGNIRLPKDGYAEDCGKSAWIHPYVDTLDQLEDITDEMAAREADAILSHEEHGGLDPEDYIYLSRRQIYGEALPEEEQSWKDVAVLIVATRLVIMTTYSAHSTSPVITPC